MIGFSRPRQEAAFPDITPLLDVVFILLIFFVIGAAFAVHGLDMDLPRAQASRAYAGRSLEIVLAEDGSLSCDDKPVNEHDLGFLLREAVEPMPGRSQRQILLKASSRATVGAFMRIVDTIRRNGGERLVIATNPPRPALEGNAQ